MRSCSNSCSESTGYPLHRRQKPDVETLRAVLRDFQGQRGERTAELVLRARKRSGVTHQLGDPQETLNWYEELKMEGRDGNYEGNDQDNPWCTCAIVDLNIEENNLIISAAREGRDASRKSEQVPSCHHA